MKRRDFVLKGLGLGAVGLFPGARAGSDLLAQNPSAPTDILPAQVRTGLPRDAMLAEIAKREQARKSNIFWHKDVVGIADFGLRSSSPRFHFVDLERGVVDSYLVSHGDGSDKEHDGWLKQFSNEEGSHCTSQGLYMTYGWYTGRYGTSMRLAGLDPTNSNALSRAIVMHRARYAEKSFLNKWGRLGRSNGCFAMGNDDFNTALIRLGGGRALFADSLGLQEDGTVLKRPSAEEIKAEKERQDLAAGEKTAADAEQTQIDQGNASPSPPSPQNTAPQTETNPVPAPLDAKPNTVPSTPTASMRPAKSTSKPRAPHITPIYTF